MRKYSLFICVSILIVCCSWAITKNSLFNANSWSIAIGKKVLLASWKDNKMGDTVILDRKHLKSTDTLFAQQFLCGYSGNGSITTITIKDQQDKVIAASTSINNQMLFVAKVSVADILHALAPDKEQMVSVYFTIDSREGTVNQTVLLGKLRIQ